MGGFSQSDVDRFAATAAWARNQAHAARNEGLRREYLALAQAYERLVEDILRAEGIA
jgi:hypothetical protein